MHVNTHDTQTHDNQEFPSLGEGATASNSKQSKTFSGRIITQSPALTRPSQNISPLTANPINTINEDDDDVELPEYTRVRQLSSMDVHYMVSFYEGGEKGPKTLAISEFTMAKQEELEAQIKEKNIPVFLFSAGDTMTQEQITRFEKFLESNPLIIGLNVFYSEFQAPLKIGPWIEKLMMRFQGSSSFYPNLSDAKSLVVCFLEYNLCSDKGPEGRLKIPKDSKLEILCLTKIQQYPLIESAIDLKYLSITKCPSEDPFSISKNIYLQYLCLENCGIRSLPTPTNHPYLRTIVPIKCYNLDKNPFVRHDSEGTTIHTQSTFRRNPEEVGGNARHSSFFKPSEDETIEEDFSLMTIEEQEDKEADDTKAFKNKNSLSSPSSSTYSNAVSSSQNNSGYLYPQQSQGYSQPSSPSYATMVSSSQKISTTYQNTRGGQTNHNSRSTSSYTPFSSPTTSYQGHSANSSARGSRGGRGNQGNSRGESRGGSRGMSRGTSRGNKAPTNGRGRGNTH